MGKKTAIGMNRYYGKASSHLRMPTGASAAENIEKDIKKWKSIKCLRANRQVSKIDCIKHILLGDDPICFRDAPCSLGRVFVEKNEKKSYLGFCAECGKSVVQEDGSDGKLYSKYFLCRECFIRLLDHELVYEKEETKEND